LDDGYIARRIRDEFNVPEARARELAFLAEGNIEKARLLTEEVHVAHWKQIRDSIHSLKTISMMDFFSLTTTWTKDTEDLEQDLKYIKLWLRDIILARFGIGRCTAFEPDEELLDSVRGTSGEALFQLYSSVEEALRDLRHNANKQLVLEGVCFAIRKGLYGQGGGDTFSEGRQGLSL
jgi:hypothetical protein